MTPELSIIIVNWNGERFLPDCLRSIVDNPPSLSYEVVVIDNASSDGSLAWLRSSEVVKLFPDKNLRIIESRSNLGFGPANNLVIAQTTTPFVFLLNPDTIVTPNAVDKLIAALGTGERVGMSAPRLLNEDGTMQVSAWINPPTPIVLLVEGFQLYKLLPYSARSKWLLGSHWRHDERRIVPAVSGAAMMVKREMVDAIGAFSPDIHMYGEDAELCDRMKRRGWQIVFEPEAEIVHLGGQSSVQRWGVSETRIKETEALLRFQETCLSPLLFFSNTLTSSFILSLYLLKSRLSGRDTSMLSRLLHLHITGFRRSLALIFGSAKPLDRTSDQCQKTHPGS